VPLLSVQHLSVRYSSGEESFNAVDDVSFVVEQGETIGIVGESGCGKTTLGRAILRLIPNVLGSIVLEGADITHFGKNALRIVRPKMQMVFQDPFSSLNPRQTIRTALERPLIVHGLGSKSEREAHIERFMSSIGLGPQLLSRYPHELSGGQRQRIAFARALVLQPKIVVCDEPVSALDVSVQAQVLNLLTEMKRQLGIAYIFISHDISVVRYMSDKIIVMYLGRIVEMAESAALWSAPRHHYTRALFAAASSLADTQYGRRSQIVRGEPASPLHPPSGCRFNPRCPAATEVCRTVSPTLQPVTPLHHVACHHPIEHDSRFSIRS
jgi:peptide/nickel transport system ATP-binding protein